MEKSNNNCAELGKGPKNSDLELVKFEVKVKS
jgi:hypothetical protein